MKNKLLFLLLLFLSAGLVVGQQVDRENVLLEISTGTWCYYCPGAAMGADDLVNYGHPVAVMENHGGDSFANVYSNARNAYYNPSGYPTAYFDGVLSYVGGHHTNSLYNSYLPKVNTRLNIPTDFTLDMEGYTTDFQNLHLVINANKVNGSHGNLILHCAVTESHIPYSWQGMSELNFVTRYMSPNQNGTTLNFSSQSNHEVTLDFALSSSWDYEHCEVVVFLQKYSTKEVYQAIKLSVSDFSTAVIADFTADNTSIMIGESVNFTDLSTGDPNSWYWEFEGGTPATYSGQYPPPITYDEEGTYDVTLTVTNENSSDSKTITDYISVTRYCMARSLNGSYIHISNIACGDINNSSGSSMYSDFTQYSTDLNQGQTDVAITITNGYYAIPSDDVAVWADWNQDEDFDDPGELIVCEMDLYWSGTETFYFDVPADASLGNTVMRVRLKWDYPNCGSPCGTTPYGEVEDYTLNIIASTVPPVADFQADNVNPEVGETVYFTDLSINDPDSWQWSFSPGTVTYLNGTGSTSQHPQVSFNESGYYTVTLEAANDGGSDTETKLNYILAEDPIQIFSVRCLLEGFYNGGDMHTDLHAMIPHAQPYNQAPWNYYGSEYTGDIPVDIVDWVLIEIRDASSPSQATHETMIAMRAALINENGYIVDVDGVSPLQFELEGYTNLFFVIHHRNHLSVISATGLTQMGGIYVADFSDGSDYVYGGPNAQKHLGANVWGMFSGDANADGTINMTDLDENWTSQSGNTMYTGADFNGDGEINNLDKDDLGVFNLEKFTYVPE